VESAERTRVPGPRDGYIGLHNFRNREGKPAQSRPDRALRRIYDLRHIFATFALGAAVSTVDRSRY
jgi:hypothetical protein